MSTYMTKLSTNADIQFVLFNTSSIIQYPHQTNFESTVKSYPKNGIKNYFYLKSDSNFD